MANIVETMRHPQEEQTLIRTERIEERIQIFCFLINVQATQTVHFTGELLFLFRERRFCEERFALFTEWKIMEHCCKNQRGIFARFAYCNGHFITMLGVVLPTPTHDSPEVCIRKSTNMLQSMQILGRPGSFHTANEFC